MSQASLSYQGLGNGWLCLYHQPREEAKAVEFIGLLYIKFITSAKSTVQNPLD